MNVRLTARGARPKIRLPTLSTAKGRALAGARSIYLDDATAPTECAVYKRELLAAGEEIEGPAVVEEYASTTVLFAGDRLLVAPTGELIIAVGGGEAA